MSETKTLLDQATAEFKSRQAEVDRLSGTFKNEDGKGFVLAPEQFRDYKAAVASANEAKDAMATFTQAEELRIFGEAPEQPSIAGTDTSRRTMEGKSFADHFMESDAFKAAKSTGFQGDPNILANIEGKSIYNFAAGSVSHQALGSAQNLGIQEVQRRKWHVRDLFHKSNTQASVLYGIRETGWVNNAAQIKQRYAADGVSPRTGGDTDVFGRAPVSKINLTNVMYPVAEIKHQLSAHQSILKDEGRLRTFLNTRMIEGVKYAEDFDLLHSVGDGEKITGLFNTPGVQAYPGLATDKYSVQVRRAITKGLLAEYDPTGLVVSPEMFENIEVEEDDNGAFRVAVSVAIGAEKRIWRLNVVETTAMSNVNFLLGSFGLGAQLHDRESVSVKVSTEHGTNFTDGACTFLGSERLALEVPRPEAFVIGTWTPPTP